MPSPEAWDPLGRFRRVPGVSSELPSQPKVVPRKETELLKEEPGLHRFVSRPSRQQMVEMEYDFQMGEIEGVLATMRQEHREEYMVLLVVQANLLLVGIEMPLWEIVARLGGLWLFPTKAESPDRRCGPEAGVVLAANFRPVKRTGKPQPGSESHGKQEKTTYWTYTTFIAQERVRAARAAVGQTIIACQDGHDLDQELHAIGKKIVARGTHRSARRRNTRRRNTSGVSSSDLELAARATRGEVHVAVQY